jgi:hypothetical protein
MFGPRVCHKFFEAGAKKKAAGAEGGGAGSLHAIGLACGRARVSRPPDEQIIA